MSIKELQAFLEQASKLTKNGKEAEVYFWDNPEDKLVIVNPKSVSYCITGDELAVGLQIA